MIPHAPRTPQQPADRVDCHAGRPLVDDDDRRHVIAHDQLDYATGRPWRLLSTHVPDCEDPTCGGCIICPERHCQVCRWRHVTVDGRGSDLTCPPCLAEVRQHIADVVNDSTRLFGEALYRGTNGRAAALAGPIANIEAWHNRRASELANRIPPGWLDQQRDDHHPLWVLGRWEREARHHLGQTLSAGTAQPTLTEASGYLDRHLHRLAHARDFAFDELAADVGRCHAHLEDVLYDGEREERGAPCPSCGAPHLVKSYGDSDGDDRWTCPRCHQWWSEKDYRAKVAGTYVHVAKRLPASQISEVYRVAEGTIRRWAGRGWVTKYGRDDQGRMLYDVSDVIRCRDEPRERDAVAASGART